MPLNPQILTWARDTAGLTVDEAARILNFKDTRDRTAVERLQALEAGSEQPSPSVLRSMAQKYHRSLLVFYLNEPPRMGDRGQDFRRIPGRQAPEYDPTLDALIRDVRGRQELIKDTLDQTEPRRVDYVGSATMETPPEMLASRVQQRIGFVLREFRQQPTLETAFNYLREKTETSGTFVLLLGNLGNYRTNIPSEVFRGYAIADQTAPLIVVNDQDARIAWAFTVLHELAHLWLGATGISNGSTSTELESYCNHVAGEILLPTNDVNQLRFLARSSFEETIASIDRFASTRKISRAMVAYKLLKVDILSRARWSQLDQHYKDEWLAAQARQTEKEKAEGGPSYYVLKRHRLGRALVDLVRNSLAEGILTHTKAGQVLGVKPRNVDPLIYYAGTRGES